MAQEERLIWAGRFIDKYLFGLVPKTAAAVQDESPAGAGSRERHGGISSKAEAFLDANFKPIKGLFDRAFP